MKPKRIFYFVDQHDQIKSGPGLFVKNFIKITNDSEYDLSIISHDIQIPDSKKIKIPLRSSNKFLTFFQQLLYSITFMYLKSKNSSSIFIVNSFFHIIFTFIIGGYYLMVNDSKYENYNFLLRNIFYLCLLRSKKIIANSEYQKNNLLNLNLGIPESKIFILNKALDSLYDNPYTNQKKSYHLSISFLKNDWEHGGLMFLLDSLSTRTEINLTLNIIGVSQDEIPKLEQIIKNYQFPFDIKIYPIVSRNKVKDILLSSNIFVNFDKDESFGVAPLEAVLCQNILVAIDRNNGLNMNMKKNNFGILIDNHNEINTVINNLINDITFYDDKILKDSETIKNNFSFDNLRSNTLDMLKKL